jgi:hypothetical protein
MFFCLKIIRKSNMIVIIFQGIYFQIKHLIVLKRLKKTP